MPNDSAPWPNKSTIREDKAVSADTLTRIINALSRRIVGDNKTIAVRSFPGGQLVIEALGGKVQGGGTPYRIARVDRLPAIPESGMREVFWNDGDDEENYPNATGDGQVWRAYAGQTRWTPTQRTTLKIGNPAS